MNICRSRKSYGILVRYSITLWPHNSCNMRRRSCNVQRFKALCLAEIKLESSTITCYMSFRRFGPSMHRKESNEMKHDAGLIQGKSRWTWMSTLIRISPFCTTDHRIELAWIVLKTCSELCWNFGLGAQSSVQLRACFRYHSQAVLLLSQSMHC